MRSAGWRAPDSVSPSCIGQPHFVRANPQTLTHRALMLYTSEGARTIGGIRNHTEENSGRTTRESSRYGGRSDRGALPGDGLPPGEETEEGDHGGALQQADRVRDGDEGTLQGGAPDPAAKSGGVEDRLRQERVREERPGREHEVRPKRRPEQQRAEQTEPLVRHGLQ